LDEKAKENWGSAGPYERYVGRWSRKVAREFLAWISMPPGIAWADVGCGTGALAECILGQCEPASIACVDKADGFVAAARQSITDSRVTFDTADATILPWETDMFDVTVSGLVLNFVPDHHAMACEMARVTKPGGKVAAYVWDYGRGMEMMRHFWDTAIAVTPSDSKLDQAERFPICRPEALQSLFGDIGLKAVSSRAIDIPTVFRNFDDYWTPFLGKTGAAPTYLASVDESTREKIRAALESRLIPSTDGTIALRARAWAVQGIV
jgi:trans-aconitate methyltransferase